MNYAIIENNIITNIIWLSPSNISDFPNAISIKDYPIHIGDTYDGQYFYHNNERIYSETEKLKLAFNILVGEEK